MSKNHYSRSVTFRPHFLMDSVDAVHRSIRGPIHSRWAVEGEDICWEVEVPPNVKAFVELPTELAEQAQIDGGAVAFSPVVRPCGMEALVSVSVSPGLHRILLKRPATSGAAFPDTFLERPELAGV